MKEIFATKERKEILREFNIRFYVDQDLNFVFRSKEDEKKAAKVLKAACELQEAAMNNDFISFAVVILGALMLLIIFKINDSNNSGKSKDFKDDNDPKSLRH